MNVSQISFSLTVWASLLATSAAFVSPNPGFSTTAPQPLHMMFGGEAAGLADAVTSASSYSTSTAALSQVNNFLVATIDADIANISDNEFAPIFAGGILVMFGGVLSALIVGGILESNNSYANVIADSYAQSEDDEEFWKSLSDEEATKTRELLAKLKESKEGKSSSSSSPAPVAKATTVLESQNSEAAGASKAESTPKGEAQKSGDMFSDY